MRRLRLLLLGVGPTVVGVALLLAVSAASPAGSGQAFQVKRVGGVVVGSAAVEGLLVIESGPVTIMSLAGKRLPVPVRVREFPFGLSPDARMVAAISGNGPHATREEYETAGVLIGAVRGGSMRTVLRGNCSASLCPYGAGPSFAWSPDSRRLAVSVEPRHGPTLLRLADRNGRVVRSFTLPPTRPEWDYRKYHHLISWSPDGSRLLLERFNNFGPTAVVVLDINTGRLRTLARLGFCNEPTSAWSPDGRFVALTATSVQDCQDLFAVVDAASARPVIRPSLDKGTGPGHPVWAPDSRSLFLSDYSSGIDRFYLAGRRTNHVTSSGVPRVALTSGLVYSTPGSPEVLHLYDFATGHRGSLMSARAYIQAVLPLSRIP